MAETKSGISGKHKGTAGNYLTNFVMGISILACAYLLQLKDKSRDGFVEPCPGNDEVVEWRKLLNEDRQAETKVTNP